MSVSVPRESRLSGLSHANKTNKTYVAACGVAAVDQCRDKMTPESDTHKIVVLGTARVLAYMRAIIRIGLFAFRHRDYVPLRLKSISRGSEGS